MGKIDREGFWDRELGCSAIVSCFFSYLFTFLKSIYTVMGYIYRIMEARSTTRCSVSASRGGALKQRWAMHINDNGYSTYVISRKRMVSWEDIMPVQEIVA